MENTLDYILPILLNYLRYFIIAGVPFLLFYFWFPIFFKRNKIQKRSAKRSDFYREIRHSLVTTAIIAGTGMLVLFSPLRDYTLFYDQITDYPIWWVPVSVVLALILHDTYFYWMHKTIHHPILFKRIHLVHHKSMNPSPWASYSFHALESVLEALIIPILLFVIPFHGSALLLFGMASFSINVYGHLGYEVMPKWYRSSFLFQVFNSSVHHNLHHEKFNGNYGLYFRVWDRIMGTEHPEYEESYDRIQEKRFGSKVKESIPLNPLKR